MIKKKITKNYAFIVVYYVEECDEQVTITFKVD